MFGGGGGGGVQHVASPGHQHLGVVSPVGTGGRAAACQASQVTS